MSIELKIKSKHLALEAKIIKHEETKLVKQINSDQAHTQVETYYWADKVKQQHSSLHSHRTEGLRWEARATHLVRAFLDNKTYDSIEKTRRPCKDYYFWNDTVPSMVRMAKSYGQYEDDKLITEWLKAKTLTKEQVKSIHGEKEVSLLKKARELLTKYCG